MSWWPMSMKSMKPSHTVWRESSFATFFTWSVWYPTSYSYPKEWFLCGRRRRMSSFRFFRNLGYQKLVSRRLLPAQNNFHSKEFPMDSSSATFPGRGPMRLISGTTTGIQPRIYVCIPMKRTYFEFSEIPYYPLYWHSETDFPDGDFPLIGNWSDFADGLWTISNYLQCAAGYFFIRRNFYLYSYRPTVVVCNSMDFFVTVWW